VVDFSASSDPAAPVRLDSPANQRLGGAGIAFVRSNSDGRDASRYGALNERLNSSATRCELQLPARFMTVYDLPEACHACAPTWAPETWPSCRGLKLGDSLGEVNSERRLPVLDSGECSNRCLARLFWMPASTAHSAWCVDCSIRWLPSDRLGQGSQDELQELLQSPPAAGLSAGRHPGRRMTRIYRRWLATVLSTRGAGKRRRAAEQEAARQACAALQK
jgi:hypothetical protein